MGKLIPIEFAIEIDQENYDIIETDIIDFFIKNGFAKRIPPKYLNAVELQKFLYYNKINVNVKNNNFVLDKDEFPFLNSVTFV